MTTAGAKVATADATPSSAQLPLHVGLGRACRCACDEHGRGIRHLRINRGVRRRLELTLKDGRFMRKRGLGIVFLAEVRRP